MSTKKIGILYICTGNYTIFWKDFYLSMEKNFITGTEKHYFIFTDASSIDFENESSRIHKIYQDDLGWPGNTLKRFHIFLKHEKELLDMDYLFFFNANLLVLKNITSDEFLPRDNENLVATLHPGFFDKKRKKFTYEKNPKSKAYTPKDQGEYYFAGGLNGGKTTHFIDAIKNMKEWVDIDTTNHITALWHDESHWNRYLVGRSDIKILQPEYLYPEGWGLPFNPRILVRDKNKYGGHNTLRKEKSTLLSIFKKILKKIPNIKNLILFFGVKKPITTQGIDIKNTTLLIITIAYNNSDILKIQHKHLKENLEESFVYLIADNSDNMSTSSRIEDYCKIDKIPYVKLPPNPYRNPSKSHGIALQWAYKNIVKSYHPHYFGFLDHDIFPDKKTYIISKLRNGMFGLIQERGEKWYLWPGFCFYDFSKIKKVKLNFMPCKDLDTGGSNYYTLYKGIDKNTLIKVPQVYIDTNTKEEVSDINDKNTSTTVEHIGDWLHIMRASNWNDQKNNKISLYEETNNSINKKIDVVIPVYNGEKFILDAITSVVNQTRSPNKIIVVDDGSTDNTNKIISDYAKNSKIEIKIVTKENGGLSSARNAGIKESDADFIAFLDADDIWLNNKLEEQMCVYETTKFKNLALVYCNYNVINSDGIIQYTNYKAPINKKRMRGMVFKELLERNKITSSGSGVLIKRKIFDTIGLFDEKLKFGEDWDMWLRIAEKFEIDFAENILVHIRKNEHNMTSDRTQSFKGELNFYKKWISYIETRYPIPLFWSDKIVYGVLSRFPKNDFFIILKEVLPKDKYKKIFRRTLGSFLFYIPLFLIRRSIAALLHPKEIGIIIGLLRHKGR